MVEARNEGDGGWLGVCGGVVGQVEDAGGGHEAAQEVDGGV